MADEVLSEVRGRVLLITLNRPDARNAVNSALAQALLAAVERLDEDKDLTAGILTGAGRGFCSGMDLKAFAQEGFPRGFERLLKRESAKPLIAAIEGFALAGGLEVALTCDLLVAARGAKLGFPTANLELGDYLEPALGVYAVKAALESGGPWHHGVANIGHRPTFGGGGVLLEVHLLDFEGDLYGKELQVEFVDYLRPEKKFDGLDSLKAQIAADCEAAREVLARPWHPRGDGATKSIHARY